MAVTLSAEVKHLIDRPNFAHLATLMADGSPNAMPVWIGRDGEQLVVCTSDNSLKGHNTNRDPRVALSIVDFHDPYERGADSRAGGGTAGGPGVDNDGPDFAQVTPGSRSRYGIMGEWR